MYPVFYNIAGQGYQLSDIDEVLKVVEGIVNHTGLSARIAVATKEQIGTFF